MTDKNIDYENPWIYKGRPFTSDDIGDYYGFVYRITNTTTQASPTSEESTSCRRENQEEQNEELQVNQTGRSTTEASEDLKQDIRRDGKRFFQKRNHIPPHNPWKSKLRRDKTIVSS